MRTYEFNGYRPYGAGEMFLVDNWTNSDPWDEINATEEAIDNGCRFEIRDENTAFLIPPAGGVDRIHFVRCDDAN